VIQRELRQFHNYNFLSLNFEKRLKLGLIWFSQYRSFVNVLVIKRKKSMKIATRIVTKMIPGSFKSFFFSWKICPLATWPDLVRSHNCFDSGGGNGSKIIPIFVSLLITMKIEIKECETKYLALKIATECPESKTHMWPDLVRSRCQ